MIVSDAGQADAPLLIVIMAGDALPKSGSYGSRRKWRAMEIDAIFSLLFMLTLLAGVAVLTWRDVVVPRRERKARRARRKAGQHAFRARRDAKDFDRKA